MNNGLSEMKCGRGKWALLALRVLVSMDHGRAQFWCRVSVGGQPLWQGQGNTSERNGSSYSPCLFARRLSHQMKSEDCQQRPKSVL